MPRLHPRKQGMFIRPFFFRDDGGQKSLICFHDYIGDSNPLEVGSEKTPLVGIPIESHPMG